MNEAVQELLKNAGILGPIVIFFGWYILLKDRQIAAERKAAAEERTALVNELKESNEARIRDAHQQINALMGLNDKWMAALNANTVVMSEIKTLLAVFRNRRDMPRADDG